MPKIREDAPERIDEYIAEAADFARPICLRLRKLVHEADGKIVEDWKWGPNFNREGMVCGIGAFKQHVSLHFFKGSLMEDPKKLFRDAADKKGSRSIKFTDVSGINDAAVKAYVRQAVKLNRAGQKVAVKKPAVRLPADLKRAMEASSGAKRFFDALAPGYRREFIEWVTTAKREATREQRVAGTVEKCARGEKLNDKYRKNC